MTPSRRLRMGMVGGGPDAFIGAVHRSAAALDGLIELAAGAFSADADRSRDAGRALFLPPDRCYPTWQEMLDGEAGRPPHDRIDFVTIVTPNHLHFPVAMAALERGFHVVCDKPMTLDVVEAERLAVRVEETDRLFCLTHNYTGYPMVKEARHLVRSGRLGAVRKVVVEYPQGWLATKIEEGGQKQASWRTDPARAGASCCIGDIGTHCENLVEYVTGLNLEQVCADLTTFVPGRRLDDDASVLLRFSGGARGLLHASQIAVGEENALALRIYGESGGIAWRQEEPNTLVVHRADRPRELRRTAGPGVSPSTAAATRLPAGHPEGFLEAFANLYRSFAIALGHRLEGSEPPPEALDFPGVHDGVRGMKLIEAVVRSSSSEEKWVPLDRPPA